MAYYAITGDDARDVGWYDALDQAFRFELVASFVQPGDRVVDLGCGLGALRSYLDNEVQYVGLERVEALAEVAMARYGDEILLSDFAEEPIPTGDVIVAIGVGVSSERPIEFESLIARMRTATARDFVVCAANDRAPVGVRLEPGFAPLNAGASWTQFENVVTNRGSYPSARACVLRAIERLEIVDPVSKAHAWFTCGAFDEVEGLLSVLSPAMASFYREKLDLEYALSN